MASLPQQPSVGSCPTAQVVGNAFVHQYYHILHQSPELVYRFYLNSSKLGRPESEGAMSCITTMQAINEKILSLDYSEFRAEIKTVDAQESLNGGVLVLVTGYLTGKDNVRQNFTQSFFLAPQDKGYFVLNDIFRYMEEVNYHNGNEGMANGAAAPLAAEHAPAAAQEHQNFEQSASLPEEEDNGQGVCNPSNNEDCSVVEEETPVPEFFKEIQMASESSSAALEETPKKSYASIVKVMKESVSPLSVPVPTPTPTSKPAPANQEQQMAVSPPPAVRADVRVSGSNANEISSIQEGEDDSYSIYIKNLPLNATASQLEEEFKRFGPIKNGGIQVRSNKQQGFCFGFVEFEVPSAVQSAVEASPITIGGRQAYVEEKRPSSSRVNSRSRFPGRGSGSGFRNDGGRGRGNYGSGRSYGRVDFNNRSEFNSRGGGGGGGRGGSSGRGRGGDGVYQRVDHLGGNNSGRMNRPSGLTSKTVAPEVPAPA